MTSKRACGTVSPAGYTTDAVQLSDDEWSHVMTFLCTTNAWESAKAIARTHQTCRAWRTLRLWSYWTSMFDIMPFGTGFPKVLAPLMQCAAERGGFVNQREAKDNLKISASWLEGVQHKTLRLRRQRVMYLYTIEDVLKVATTKYGCLQAVEEHILKCKQRKRTMERNRQLRHGRRQEVETLLEGIGATFMVHRFMVHRTYPEIETYVNSGKGTLEAIRVMATEQKAKRDEEQARFLAVADRRQQVQAWASSTFDLSWDAALRISVVRQYIHDLEGPLTLGHAMQALSKEKDRLEERRRQSSEQAPLRRMELKHAI
jgi:hypothetical protein